MISGWWRLAALVALCVVQLAVPVSMIAGRELVLRQGSVHRFRAGPVDPYDAFRGRFVALSLDAATYRGPGSARWSRGDRVWAVLGEDAGGFTTIDALRAKRPPGDRPAIRVRVAWAGSDQVRLDLPFDRYYMDERLAPEAERLVRQRAGRAERPASVTVRVLGGRAVLEELWVGGRPISELARELAGTASETSP